MQIKDIMNKSIISITSDATIMDACKRFYRKKIGSLIVMEQGKIAGIITERDIISRVVILDKDPNNTTVKEIMSSDVITINYNDDIQVAAKILSENNIKKLPVKSDTGTIVGIITTSDISKVLYKHQKQIIQ